jgi:4-aminobutyrate aminotransferase
VHSNVARMIPPLIVTGQQVDDGVELWAEAVCEAVS